MLVGLGAAGRAGNASAIALLLLLASPLEDTVRDGAGDTPALRTGAGFDEEDIHGVWPGLAPMPPPPPRLDEPAAGKAGNGLVDDVVDQLAFLLACERCDCAVELLSFSTLDPPLVAVPPFSASPVAEPGNDG